MAGEWLKFEKSTLDKPEVLAVAAALGWDADMAIGKFVRMWSWFDTHTVNGDARGVTPALLDSILRVTGFVSEVQKVGWLEVHAWGIRLPKFDVHCGETAKQRALGAKRNAVYRASNAKGDASSVTEASPREEKRREEKKDQEQEATPLGAGAPPFGVHQPIVDAYHELLPNCQSIATPTPKRLKRLANAAKLAKRVCASHGWTYEPGTFWHGYFAVCANDPWLRGDVANPNNARWKQNLDVLLADERLAQVIDQAINSMRGAA